MAIANIQSLPAWCVCVCVEGEEKNRYMPTDENLKPVEGGERERGERGYVVG